MRRKRSPTASGRSQALSRWTTACAWPATRSRSTSTARLPRSPASTPAGRDTGRGAGRGYRRNPYPRGRTDDRRPRSPPPGPATPRRYPCRAAAARTDGRTVHVRLDRADQHPGWPAANHARGSRAVHRGDRPSRRQGPRQGHARCAGEGEGAAAASFHSRRIWRTVRSAEESFRDLTSVFLAALLLSALLLTLLFERWAYTVAVISTVLLSATAVFFGLWLTGIELDISALMGLTMVVGMLTELAIFYLAELEPGAVVDGKALLRAGEARLRPIVMSALIAILTLMPLALGLGRGSASNGRWRRRSSSASLWVRRSCSRSCRPYCSCSRVVEGGPSRRPTLRSPAQRRSERVMRWANVQDRSAHSIATAAIGSPAATRGMLCQRLAKAQGLRMITSKPINSRTLRLSGVSTNETD